MGEHIVKQGECLASIAKHYGFASYRTIYDDPANAEFKRKRPNPNVICPGDRLVIPGKSSKEESGGTAQRHRFKAKKQGTMLRIVVKDERSQPLANKRYQLHLDGRTEEGKTDGQGLIEQPIPPDAGDALLVVWLDDHDPGKIFASRLALGHLDPIEEDRGVQARLNNLGFFCGPVDGIVGPRTEAALRAYQGKAGLPQTGRADAATRQKLLADHDRA